MRIWTTGVRFESEIITWSRCVAMFNGRKLNAGNDQHSWRSGHSVLLEYDGTLVAHAGRAHRIPNHVQATSRNDGNMSLSRDVSAATLDR